MEQLELGAHLVEEDQSRIPFICLGDSSENETENRRLHPKRWMGKELKNKQVDGARSLLSLLTYLMPAFQLGNMKGDAGALRGGGVRASDWLSKGRRFESRLRRFFTPTPAESLPFLTPPLAETVN